MHDFEELTDYERELHCPPSKIVTWGIRALLAVAALAAAWTVLWIGVQLVLGAWWSR